MQVYNINDTATQVLALKQIKENMGVNILHKNGYGVHEVEETNATTIRMMKVPLMNLSARKLGEATNGKFFNADGAKIATVTEYDLNLLYVFDNMVDLPEVQQNVCPVNIFDAQMKNYGIDLATEINASTLAEQLANRFNAAHTATNWDNIAVVMTAQGKPYQAIQDASTMLDDGDIENGVQSFPFEEREVIMRPQFRAKLMSTSGVLIGGSNYAQSMIAKGGVSPEARKEFGNQYVGEIDLMPCYQCPTAIWQRASKWADNTLTKFDNVEAIVCAASATDRGISQQDYIKTIDSPDGVGKRLQPLTRWGINICYGKGIVPILKNGTAAPDGALTVMAPGSRA